MFVSSESQTLSSNPHAARTTTVVNHATFIVGREHDMEPRNGCVYHRPTKPCLFPFQMLNAQLRESTLRYVCGYIGACPVITHRIVSEESMREQQRQHLVRPSVIIYQPTLSYAWTSHRRSVLLVSYVAGTRRTVWLHIGSEKNQGRERCCRNRTSIVAKKHRHRSNDGQC